MTGPEHYVEAEQLLKTAEYESDDAYRLRLYVMAQVHATLAGAAATALAGFGEFTMPASVYLEAAVDWRSVGDRGPDTQPPDTA